MTQTSLIPMTFNKIEKTLAELEIRICKMERDLQEYFEKYGVI